MKKTKWSGATETITRETMVRLLGEKNVMTEREFTVANIKLANQLKAMKEAREQGICYKCDADTSVDQNAVCANCQARDV